MRVCCSLLFCDEGFDDRSELDRVVVCFGVQETVRRDFLCTWRDISCSLLSCSLLLPEKMATALFNFHGKFELWMSVVVIVRKFILFVLPSSPIKKLSSIYFGTTATKLTLVKQTGESM